MSVVIKPVGPQDYEHWLPLWQGYLAFYQAPYQAAVAEVSWQRFLDPAEPMHSWLAWQDGKAVGMVNTVEHRSSWMTGNYCYLQDLYVDPACRGGGVGKSLIETVYAHAAAAGCGRVYWLTHESNATARSLYDTLADNLGYIQYRKNLS
ncbi:GNAT family N-acetyltransferase [uncultured Aquitalea sp.]|uniref:GNAT family N-acetyltransferase n=1 Tax=uncultured Aquitalea sp. TaxID=540272 RepID=UPI0025E16CB9|nr:GNAT family N-acetyltransferase [uncultured Aquitalea sp.]